MIQFEQEWLNGTVSLGAVTGWTADEIRFVSELGFALAKQGLNQEAIVIFEGLMVLAPATTYFEAALGALWLREKLKKNKRYAKSLFRIGLDRWQNLLFNYRKPKKYRELEMFILLLSCA